MYYASFFPAAVRPFDGRGPLDGVAAAAALVGRGGERGEIPLDLSLKHVRPDGSDATEELLLLEHRKLAAAYGRHLLDPAAFLRLQHYQQRVAADAFLQQVRRLPTGLRHVCPSGDQFPLIVFGVPQRSQGCARRFETLQA